MNSQYRQLEKLHLHTLPMEHEREVRQMLLARKACSGNRGLLVKLGSRMMQLGSQLKLRFGSLDKAKGSANYREMQAT